tara:strand:- start:18 stop:746 length:729 start_codon:yes stop_codon:yes gene_type:complete
MANEGSTRMTTTQLRAMISGGATRSQLPTVASGQSVTSTRDSAQQAYLAQVQKAARTAAFRAAQTQTARQSMQARTAKMISVAENEKNLPNFDAQSEQFNQNNNVNPSSLYTNQPVNVTGQTKSSVMDYGLNTNANYNYATAMNDYQTANPAGSINLGQTVNEPYFTAGLSSVPDDNEVKTSLLGGDIQHQETDVNTNLEYELPLSQQSTKNVNWANSITAGSSIVPIAGIGLLSYFMGKRN